MTKLEVRENVTIEELVPVVPTDEEMVIALDAAKIANGFRQSPWV